MYAFAAENLQNAWYTGAKLIKDIMENDDALIKHQMRLINFHQPHNLYAYYCDRIRKSRPAFTRRLFIIFFLNHFCGLYCV